MSVSEYVGSYNRDGSPHGLKNGVRYSTLPVQGMRASMVWLWYLDPIAENLGHGRDGWIWVPYGVPDGETPEQLIEWIRLRGPCCIARVKRWEPVMCARCKRSWSLSCSYEGHEKEVLK